MKFSERIGIVAPRTALQVRSMDDSLRVALWNALSLTYFEYASADPLHGVTYPHEELSDLMRALWVGYLNRPLDCYQAAGGRLKKNFRSTSSTLSGLRSTSLSSFPRSIS